MSQPDASLGRTLGRATLCALLLVAVAAIAALLVGVEFDLRSQLIYSAALLAIAMLVNRSGGTRATHALILVSLLVTTRYLYWRATSTLGFDDAASAVAGYTLFGAELYAYLVTLLGYLQIIRPLKRKPAALPDDRKQWPTVDVFIPTYNEPLHVVAATIAGATNLEWPRDRISIHLLDDGDRPAFRRYAAEAGIHYRARKNNQGAKAGNINEALAATRADLVAIFDCDHIPTRSFLQSTVGWFVVDESLAQLQTPHHFYNPDPIERNLSVHDKVPSEGALFYGLIQDGNDLWNATFFCGSCAVIRRRALEEIGGIAVETVTEDAHTSLKLHRRGWNSAYINVIQAAGLATETLAAHVNQRIRWARGLAQILRVENPLFASGLNLMQRLCYLNATVHYLYALPRIAFLIAPLCFLFFDLYVIQAEAMMVAAMALPHLLHSNLTTARIHGRWRHAFWAEVYETLLSFYILVPTLVALVAPRRGSFNVTEKGHTTDRDYFSFRIARPFLAIALLNVAGLGAGFHRLFITGTSDTGTTWLNMAWTTYNLIILGVALSVACESRQTRSHFRRTLPHRAWLSSSDGHRVAANIVDLSESGMRVRLDSVPGDAALDEVLVRVDHAHVELQGVWHRLPLSAVETKSFSNEHSGNDNERRFRFDELSAAERRSLVGILYSPADTWMGADKTIDTGPVRALLSITRYGMFGWMRILGLLLPRRGNRRIHHSEGNGHASSGGSDSPAAVDTSAHPPRRPSSRGVTTATALLCVSLCLLVTSRPVTARESLVYELDMLTDRIETAVDLADLPYGLRVPFAVRQDSVVDRLHIALELSYRDHDTTAERQLRLRLNDDIVWRAGSSVADEERVELDIPGVALDEYNTLTFELGTDDERCSATDDTAFDLTLHRDSQLTLEADRLPLANELSSLPLPFFDARDPRIARLGIVLQTQASDGQPSETMLHAAAGIAGWYGRLAGYRGALFDVSYDRIPAGDVVVIASGDTLPQGIATPSRDGPSISLIDNPVDATRRVLLVHAPDEEQLGSAVARLETRGTLHAATATSGAAARVSGEQRGNGIDDTESPLHSTGLASPWIPLDEPVAFHTIPGIDPDDLRVANNNFTPLIVPFALRGDFHDTATSRHRLKLGYRYAPDLPDHDERLFVSLNGRELTSVSLSEHQRPGLLGRSLDSLSRLTNPSKAEVVSSTLDSREGTFQGELDIEIPHHALGANNRLEIRFSAPPSLNGLCQPALLDDDGLSVQARVLPDSTLTIDAPGHAVALPDLAVYANTGIPYTRDPLLGGTELIVPQQPAEHMVALMLSAVGRLAAQIDRIPGLIQVSRGGTSGTRADRILIGADFRSGTLDAFFDETPFDLTEDRLSLELVNARSLYTAVAGLTTPWNIDKRFAALADNTATRTLMLGEERGLIVETETPATRNGTSLLLFSQGPLASDVLSRALVDRRLISQWHGTAGIVDENGLRSLDTGRRYFVSDLTPLRTLGWWVSANVPIAVFLSLFGAVLFALAFPPLLERVASRRLKR